MTTTTRAPARNSPVRAELIGNTPGLYYGNARTALAHVIPDALWSGMWRIAWPDGTTSDLLNLSRACDAAAAIAERGPPARNRRRLQWRYERSERSKPALLPAPMRSNGRPYVQHRATPALTSEAAP